MTHRAGSAALLLVLALGPGPRARGEPVEPPPDVADGEDYEAEIPDSVATGSIETSLGATGGSAGRARGRRRVRFEDGALAGDVRDGADDPLAGGEVEARGGSGRWTVGRLGVAWGRGLVLGASGEPWRIAGSDW